MKIIYIISSIVVISIIVYFVINNIYSNNSNNSNNINRLMTHSFTPTELYTFDTPIVKIDSNIGKEMTINFAPDEDKDNEYYTDNKYHCGETCSCVEYNCEDFGFEYPEQLRGYRNRDCSIDFDKRTLVSLNTNNNFYIKVPFGSGKYKITLGLGDCSFSHHSFPHFVIKVGERMYRLDLSEHNKQDHSEFEYELQIDTDIITLYDDREPVEQNKGTSNEVLYIEERDENVIQPTRINYIKLKRIPQKTPSRSQAVRNQG